MLIIHSVQKLLNSSRLEVVLYITQPNLGQHLHSWYGRLLATSFRGKMVVMYVHEPSLTVVLCKGKTIQGTWKPFIYRLQQLLLRFQFPSDFWKANSVTNLRLKLLKRPKIGRFHFLHREVAPALAAFDCPALYS